MSRVAQHHSDRTNQKLYFAKLAWQQAEQASTQQIHHAFIESSVFHLHGALLAFYQELASFYSINHEQPTMESIRSQLEIHGQISPELLLLSELSVNSYLAELLRMWQLCQYAPKPKEKTVQSSNRIDMQPERYDWLSAIDELKQWHKQLQHTIETLRESMVEF